MYMTGADEAPLSDTGQTGL